MHRKNRGPRKVIAVTAKYSYIDYSELSHLSQPCAADFVSGLDSLHQSHISYSQQSPQLHQPNHSSQLNVTNSVDPDNSFRQNNNSDSTLKSFGLDVSDPIVAPDFPSQLYVSNSGKDSSQHHINNNYLPPDDNPNQLFKHDAINSIEPNDSRQLDADNTTEFNHLSHNSVELNNYSAEFNYFSQRYGANSIAVE
ncbi:10384_t:CDS:2 [Racocetra fulgida]|uniref:10384_t:CDS:1 n=1 Tax=Racocetra fulgida TaxID=60492 RepID=A0A9N8ZBL9_9GLOM|nr:10384_t:CDS:2 [Racocetra fulgida]